MLQFDINITGLGEVKCLNCNFIMGKIRTHNYVSAIIIYCKSIIVNNRIIRCFTAKVHSVVVGSRCHVCINKVSIPDTVVCQSHYQRIIIHGYGRFKGLRAIMIIRPKVRMVDRYFHNLCSYKGISEHVVDCRD